LLSAVVAEEAGLAGGWIDDFSRPSKDYPAGVDELRRAEIVWEQFPSVKETVLDSVRYVHRPRDFFYSPISLKEFLPGFSLYPEPDPLAQYLTPQGLAYFSFYLERPSGEFPSGVERIELNQGIAQRALELVNGGIAAETEFSSGRAVFQRIDLDLDGRMETERRFMDTPDEISSRTHDPLDYAKIPLSSQSDWDGDGIFETGEDYIYTSAGGERSIRSWDMNKDGYREYSDGTYPDIFNR
jgi:hypothetical protein